MSKPNGQKLYSLLHLLKVPLYPWEAIGVDFVGLSLDSKNHDGTFDLITVIIDLFASMIHLIPC